MEIHVKILSVELATFRESGRYDLHCKVETQSDEFVNSSIVKIGPAAGGATPAATPTQPEWPTFSYNFRTRQTEVALLFTLSTIDTTEDRLHEVARSVVPYGISESSPSQRAAILTSAIHGLALGRYQGKILFEVTYNCGTLPDPGYLGVHWPELTIPQNNLPLLSSRPLLDYQAEEDEQGNDTELEREEEEREEEEEDEFETRLTIQELALRESHDLAPQDMVFPGSNPCIAVFFHSINLPTHIIRQQQLELQPVISFAHDREVSTRSSPFSKWVDNGFGNIQAHYSYLSVLKSASLHIRSSQQPFLGLYLFSRGMQDILMCAYEDVSVLLPFCFHHRVWPYGIESPVLTVDQFMKGSCHVLTSTCLIPPRADYRSHEGLEVVVTNITLDSREVILGAQIVDSRFGELHAPQHDWPPFINPQNQASNNYKLALLQGSPAHTKSYLFFDTGSSTNLQSLREHGLSLSFQFFVLDPTNSDAWWKSFYSSTQLPLNGETLFPLLSEDGKRGLVWQASFEVMVVDFILRWKTKEMQFLGDMEQTYIEQLPKLDDLAHPPSPSQSSLVSMLQQTTSIPVDEVHQRGTTESPHLVPQRGTTEPPVPQSIVTESHQAVLLAQYRAALEEMKNEIARLREEKGHTDQENQQLLQQLNEVTSQQGAAITTDVRLRAQLETMPKVELVNLAEHLQSKLDQEMGQKTFFQEKVHSLQNALIQKNDMESELLSIQEAHTAQQILVQELQRKVKKYRRCYDAWLKQEATIARMEEALVATTAQAHSTQQPRNVHQDQPSPEQSSEDMSDASRETVRVLELRLVNALRHISQLEASHRHTTIPLPQYQHHVYPTVPPIAAVEHSSSANELQIQHDLLQAEARIAKLKQENRQLRTDLAQVREQNENRNTLQSQVTALQELPPAQQNVGGIRANLTSF